MPFSDDLRRYGPDAAYAITPDEARTTAPASQPSHYENFSVVTWLTPQDLRPAFAAVYAFCRWSDDLGDEVGDAARATELLDWWRGELRAMYGGEARHPVFLALPRDRRRVRHPDRAVRGPDLGVRAGPGRHRLRHLRPAPRLLHPLGRPGRAPRPLPGPGVRRGERPALRLHLHGPATRELLAGRRPRPRHPPRLPPARGPRAVRLSRMPTCTRAGSRPRSASCSRFEVEPGPRRCCSKGGRWCRGCRGRSRWTSTSSRGRAWRSWIGSRVRASTSGRVGRRWASSRRSACCFGRCWRGPAGGAGGRPVRPLAESRA